MIRIAEEMLTSKRARYTAILILLILLFASFVYYGSQDPRPEYGDYPSEEHLIKDHRSYINEKVNVGGRVIGTEPLTIRAKYGRNTLDLTVLNSTVSPEEGDQLTVYGILREDLSVEAINSVNRPKLNVIYMYVVSMVAAGWVGYRIITQYRWEDWAASPKKGGEEDG